MNLKKMMRNRVTDSRKIKDSNNLSKALYEAWSRVDTALREMEQGKTYLEQEIYLKKGMDDLLENIGRVEYMEKNMLATL